MIKARRMGKGERVAFDARLANALERLEKEKGFYPSLREISEYLNDGSSTATIFRALQRMLKNKELPAGAIKIYGVTHGKKGKTVKG